jgi:hypothetical protein
MVIPPHYHVGYKSRGRKQNAVASASYIRGENLYCEEDSKLKTFGNRRETVYFSEIILPKGSPDAFKDPQILWNEVQKRESGKTARFCQTVSAALPYGLTHEQNVEIARKHAQWLSAEHGVVVDFSLHLPPEGEKNTHAHFMYTTRSIDENGWAPTKVDAFRGNKGAQVSLQRQHWQQIVNMACFEADYRNKHGELIQVDMRSFAERGIDRIPQIHQGVRAKELDRKGLRPTSKDIISACGREIRYTEIDQGMTRSEYNAQIIAMNERLDYVERHQNIDVQLIEAERKIEIHLDSVDDLSKELALGLLPEHLRAKFMAALLRLKRLQFQKLFEMVARERKKRKEKKKRVQEQMREARRRLLELEEKQEQVRAVKRLYAHIYSFCYATTSLTHHHKVATMPPKFITRKEHNVLFKAKAEIYRAEVLPEYRPALKIKVANSKPIDNGGKATPPPIIRNRFNETARTEKYRAMNESLIWLEKRNPERPDSQIDEVKKEFLENSIDMFALPEEKALPLPDQDDGKKPQPPPSLSVH